MRPPKAHTLWIRSLAVALTSLGLCAPLACSDSSDGNATHAANSDGTTDSGGSGGSSSGGSSSGGQTSSGGTESTSQGNTGTGGSAGAEGGSAGEAGSTNGSGGAAGSCSVDVAEHPLSAGIHVTECSAIEYTTNPPSSGEHYGVWAAYQNYDFALPRGYWVHALEHGAVVITYNCDDGCSDEVEQVKSFIDDLPPDPRCSAAGLEHQIILTPDPLLDTRWAMSSWGFTLRADCVDEDAFERFYLDHFGHGPEDLCGGGTAFTEAMVTPGCGAP